MLRKPFNLLYCFVKRRDNKNKVFNSFFNKITCKLNHLDSVFLKKLNHSDNGSSLIVPHK
jgi:hypothetical protein